MVRSAFEDFAADYSLDRVITLEGELRELWRQRGQDRSFYFKCRVDDEIINRQLEYKILTLDFYHLKGSKEKRKI